MSTFKRFFRKPIGIMGLVCASAFVTTVSQAQTIGMESASENSVLGMLPQAMAPYWAKSGINIQLALNQTLTKSLLKIALGKPDSAVVPPLAYEDFQKGTGPYAKIAAKTKSIAGNVRALFAIPGSYYHAITSVKSGIKSWPEAKGKRVYIGPPAGAANQQIIALAKAGGLMPGSYDAIKAPWGAATQSYQDGQFDVYVGTFSLGSQAVAELGLTNKFRLLGIPKSKMNPPEGAGMQPAVIPPHTYPGQVNEKKVITWQTLMMMVVKKSMSDEVAYKLTKDYIEHRKALAKSNVMLRDLLTTNYFSGVNMTLHPGAVRAYKEAGIKIPAKLLP